MVAGYSVSSQGTGQLELCVPIVHNPLSSMWSEMNIKTERSEKGTISQWGGQSLNIFYHFTFNAKKMANEFYHYFLNKKYLYFIYFSV